MTVDSDDTNDSTVSTSVEVAAVAKAEASAKYERKINVSITVPEDVTREKAKAFLDAISPLTQPLGLIGDWIADRRELLRVRRLRTIEVIAGKAYEQIESQSEKPRPIPLKALQPMLENASLEDADDESLTTKWASLIASASINYDSEVIAFSRILSELSPRECTILERIFGGRWGWVLGERVPAAMKKFYENDSVIKPLIRQAVIQSDQGIFDTLRQYVDQLMPMQFTFVLTRGVTERVNWVDKMLKESFFAENEVGFGLLEAQGLISKQGRSYDWKNGEIPVAADWVTLTELGTRFVSRVIPRSSETDTNRA
jgi:hypothetical protein